MKFFPFWLNILLKYFRTNIVAGSVPEIFNKSDLIDASSHIFQFGCFLTRPIEYECGTIRNVPPRYRRAPSIVEVNERERVFQILTSSRGARNMKFERYRDHSSKAPKEGGGGEKKFFYFRMQCRSGNKSNPNHEGKKDTSICCHESHTPTRLD